MMEQTPYVSIIVPVYKVQEEYLRKCIESLLSQTLPEIEVLLVDDGSPDQCGNICDEYAEKDSRVQVIHHENSGLCAARNAGFNRIRGKWFLFVDGDDWLDEDACRNLLKTAEDHAVQVVQFAANHEFIRQSEPFSYSMKDGTLIECTGANIFSEMILDFNSGIGDVWGKLYLTSIAHENNILHDSELRQGAESLDYNLRYFRHVSRFYFHQKYYYHYRYNKNSISSRYDDKNAEYILRCFHKINDYLAGWEDTEAVVEKLYTRIDYAAVTTAISGFFHPENKDGWKIRTGKMDSFLTDPLVSEALRKADPEELSSLRRTIILLLKKRKYHLISLIAWARYIQKRGK